MSLEERAADAGRAWALAVRDQLHAEGRRAAGGWPGTLSEARGLAARVFVDAPDERARLTGLVYTAAKTYWLLERDPDDGDD